MNWKGAFSGAAGAVGDIANARLEEVRQMRLAEAKEQFAIRSEERAFERQTARDETLHGYDLERLDRQNEYAVENAKRSGTAKDPYTYKSVKDSDGNESIEIYLNGRKIENVSPEEAARRQALEALKAGASAEGGEVAPETKDPAETTTPEPEVQADAIEPESEAEFPNKTAFGYSDVDNIVAQYNAGVFDSMPPEEVIEYLEKAKEEAFFLNKGKIGSILESYKQKLKTSGK